MEEKIMVLDVLKTNRVFIGPRVRNVARSHCRKINRHSNTGDTTSHIQGERKDIIEEQKSKKKIFKFLGNLNVGGIIDPRLDSFHTKKKGGDSFFKKTCKKMDSNESGITTENNNVEDVKYIHSSKTIHSNDGLIILHGSKEKTDGFKDEGMQDRKHKSGKDLRKLFSLKREFSSFEEFDSSEGDEHHNEGIPNTIIVKNIPVTVQEWINHLPSKEAGNCMKINTEVETSGDNQNVTTADSTALLPAKLSRAASLQSSSSLDSLLDARRPDPVEIFLNLGFGGVPGIDMENCRIPTRFLVPSKCKGGDWNEFLRREFIQAQNFECSSLGFRGLSGPSYRRPSAIVANIMEKLRERSVPQSYNRTKPTGLFKKGSNEKSNQNKLTPEFQSVLSPDSRKFLQNQGKISPEVPRRRIIFGQKSFAFAHNGEFVEVESRKKSDDSENGVPPVSLLTKNGNGKMDVSVAENLLQIRRSSLQKQKKVDDDYDLDDVFRVDDGENPSDESEVRSLDSINDKCSNKEGSKIPRRFLSTTNLISLEAESNLSDIMRREVEKEILSLSNKIKEISDQELVAVLRQVKQLTSTLENTGHASVDV
ncbi:hypothetical protein RUM44_009426 [Polyplax serrata]|uniref:ITPR-interacting domain-containing protein n=1 Tax=Polyplax serrata TaxID=468196 RepID=A0ABR1ASN3_POLSC